MLYHHDLVLFVYYDVHDKPDIAALRAQFSDRKIFHATFN